MTRRASFLLAAFDALLAVAGPIALLLLPMTLIWLVENDPSIEWLVTVRVAADIWMLAHGVALEVPAGIVLGTAVPAFQVTLLPLALTLLIAATAFRAGRRMATARSLWPAWLGSALSYGGATVALAQLARHESIAPQLISSYFLPTLVFLAIAIGASLFARPMTLIDWPEASERQLAQEWLAAKRESMPWALRVLWQPALRAGSAIVALLLLAASLILAYQLATSWVAITGLYEALRVSPFGAATVTVGQLALLPNIVIFVSAWLTGAGFSLGTGSIISPLGTNLGPVPAIPVLGALPPGEAEFGLSFIAVPLLAAFIATLLVRRFTAELRFEFASPVAAAFGLGGSIAAVAAVEFGILSALASGAAGPGRLSQLGVNPWWAAALLFVEVAVIAIPVAFFSARPVKPDLPAQPRPRKVN